MWVNIIQRLLRHNNVDELPGDNSIVQGKSSANQREAYWSSLKQLFADDTSIFCSHKDPN